MSATPLEQYRLLWPGKAGAIAEAERASETSFRQDADCVPSQAAFDHNSLFIEGDNLEALKLLRERFFERIKMVYIDPPYNTGKKFVYSDNFSTPDSSGQHPSTARHSEWLNMMYPRLLLARDLIRDDGVFFVSIDDNEIHNLRIIMDEIFGPEHFLAHVIWQHSVQPKGYPHTYSLHHNHILSYRKSEAHTIAQLDRTSEDNKAYSNPDNDPKGKWRSGDVRNSLYRKNLRYELDTPSGKRISPPKNGWRWSRETLAGKIKIGEIYFSEDETRIHRKIYLDEQKGRTPQTIWFGKDVGVSRDGARELKAVFGGEQPFDTVKPMALIERMMKLANVAEGDIVLDFFAGSCTTAHAVIRSGAARFIVVQSPESINESLPHGKAARELGFRTIADIGKARIQHALELHKHATDCEFLRLATSLAQPDEQSGN